MMQGYDACVETSSLLSFSYMISGQPAQVVRFDSKEHLPEVYIDVSYVNTDL